VRLSVVDVGWPSDVPVLVPELDRLGYHRYWVTEHHAPGQSAAPTVLAAAAAGATPGGRIRIGTAGVLLNFRSPAAVVSDFAVLELLHPGRIDLGVAASTAGDGAVAEALLDGRPAPTRTRYDEKVAELARLVADTEGDDPVASELGPTTAGRPDVWVCGTSTSSAELAGRLGLAYAFHDHLKDVGTDGPGVVDRYLEAFDGSDARRRGVDPTFVVAAYGLCADSEKRSIRLLGEAQPAYRGRPEQCHEQLCELADRYGTTEVATYALSRDSRDRLHSYRLLASAFDLPAAVEGLDPAH